METREPRTRQSRYGGATWAEEGMAMVLAICMVALLSLLGVWLVVQSGSTYRITQSVERHDVTFNLAEGALQLSWRCLTERSNEEILRDLTPNQDVTPAQIPYMQPDQSLGTGPGTLTPQITFLDARTVPGWDINKFRGYYYLARGQGVQPLPDQRGGDAQSRVVSFIRKIGQVRSR
ncbi:hypothetical protein [Desulfacinum infernum]|nr:hypothetical protein [Desulfacinum infernum]